MSQRADNRTDVRRAEWMRRAIALARPTQPHPNPRVGALVITSDGTIAAERAHTGPGAPHAEAAALEAAGTAAERATLVVTLEPCNHTGRTPPCTDAIIAAGIAKVIVGVTDPDSRVAGSGIARLVDAGIEVEVGVLEREVVGMDPGYHHHRTTGMPRITLKVAATLDGQVAAADGTSQWITGEAARRDAHELRAAGDAVLVGAGTLRRDDPRLTVRLEGYDGSQPTPIVAAGTQPLPDHAALYERNPIVYTPRRHPNLPASVEQVVLWHPDGVDVRAMAKDLGERGILALLVEGGPTIARSLLREGMVDHVVAYLGARIAGGVGLPMFAGEWRTLDDAHHVSIDSVTRLGDDLRIDATISGGS